eukprot:superscaffoldBa00000134_g1963
MDTQTTPSSSGTASPANLTAERPALGPSVVVTTDEEKLTAELEVNGSAGSCQLQTGLHPAESQGSSSADRGRREFLRSTHNNPWMNLSGFHICPHKIVDRIDRETGVTTGLLAALIKEPGSATSSPPESQSWTHRCSFILLLILTIQRLNFRQISICQMFQDLYCCIP